VAREREVIAEKAKAQGKPPHVLKTFCKEVCLVDQAYVHDQAKSVGWRRYPHRQLCALGAGRGDRAPRRGFSGHRRQQVNRLRREGNR
jgi:hypothetical protein